MAYDPLGLVMTYGRPHSGTRRYMYKSTDPMSTVRGAGYISDAKYRYMEVGDVVEVIQVNGSGVPTEFYISIVMAMNGAAADLADGTSMTLTNT